MTIMTPPLALGQTVHEVVESLSILPVEDRLSNPLTKKFDKVWEKVSGKLGGFTSDSQEKQFKQRGVEMLEKIHKQLPAFNPYIGNLVTSRCINDL